MSTDSDFPPRTSADDIEEGRVFQPKFDGQGLIPAIASDHVSGEVLMFAWMNREALHATISSKVAHFWSRSRGKLWRKGEDSGNTLSVLEIRTDCDQDVIWMRVKVEGDGVACHTARRSCFYRALDLEAVTPPVRLKPID
jgi:phosphoribosyl-AMP cyclohydrolase